MKLRANAQNRHISLLCSSFYLLHLWSQLCIFILYVQKSYFRFWILEISVWLYHLSLRLVHISAANEHESTAVIVRSFVYYCNLWPFVLIKCSYYFIMFVHLHVPHFYCYGNLRTYRRTPMFMTVRTTKRTLRTLDFLRTHRPQNKIKPHKHTNIYSLYNFGAAKN